MISHPGPAAIVISVNSLDFRLLLQERQRRIEIDRASYLIPYLNLRYSRA
jgi:hypothetical protein